MKAELARAGFRYHPFLARSGPPMLRRELIRPRVLFEAKRRIAARPVLFLTGPPGAGKRTLLYLLELALSSGGEAFVPIRANVEQRGFYPVGTRLPGDPLQNLSSPKAREEAVQALEDYARGFGRRWTALLIEGPFLPLGRPTRLQILMAENLADFLRLAATAGHRVVVALPHEEHLRRTRLLENWSRLKQQGTVLGVPPFTPEEVRELLAARLAPARNYTPSHDLDPLPPELPDRLAGRHPAHALLAAQRVVDRALECGWTPPYPAEEALEAALVHRTPPAPSNSAYTEVTPGGGA